MISTDYLVIGGGIIGLNMALEYKRRNPSDKVILIEKEQHLGLHASGRNSGVLHAGFYYSADSLKARFTKEGNQALTEFCLERGLSINQCGKLVVTKNENELPTLAELLKRGRNYGIPLDEVDEKTAREIEPRAKTVNKALYSPSTSSINPLEVMHCLEQDARDLGVEILFDTQYLLSAGNIITTNHGKILAGYIVNSAGLYADRIALDFGYSQNYRIIPFKGLYLYSSEPVGSVRTNIYPVPDLNNPFLGVHFTLTADGHIKVGPTAIPAFWREHYSGIRSFNLSEMMDIVYRELGLFVSNRFGFRKLAITELSKYYKPRMVALASELLTNVEAGHYRTWGKPGIRAQLLNIRKQSLEMDFHFEGDSTSFHILNAVSPAFTCSIPFVRYLTDKIEQLRA